MPYEAMIDQSELLDFSQNYVIQRPANAIDRFFTDEKTASLMAKWFYLTGNDQITAVATAHAFDTEAQIASRVIPKMIETKKLLIKRKINQSERLQLLEERGGLNNAILNDVLFNDIKMLADSVKDRTLVAKAEVLATGTMSVKENDLDIAVDYGVPDENKMTLDWSQNDVDYLGDIQKVVDVATESGRTITGMITSRKNISKMMLNKNIQTAILGTNGSGAMVSRMQIQALLAEYFGFSEIVVSDDKYKVENADGTTTMHRYFPEDVVTFYARTGASLGVGLWGVTPEEAKQGAFTQKSMNQFITITQWEKPDPVAVWTKASGLFIPVLPDPSSLFICNVGGTKAVRTRTRNTKASDTKVEDTKVEDTKVEDTKVEDTKVEDTKKANQKKDVIE